MRRSPPAAASTKWADLRVVTHTGRTLAEFRQYTGSTTVRASTKGDCFGSPSTNKRYTMGDANARPGPSRTLSRTMRSARWC
jgi:hypothetical protein